MPTIIRLSDPGSLHQKEDNSLPLDLPSHPCRARAAADRKEYAVGLASALSSAGEGVEGSSPEWALKFYGESRSPNGRNEDPHPSIAHPTTD